MLREVRQSEHYQLRKGERGKILDLKVPAVTYQGYDWKEVEPKLKDVITERLFNLLRSFETKQTAYSGKINRVFLILKPRVVKDGKEYPVTMHVKYTKYDAETKKTTLVDNYGEAYVLIVTDNALVTLLLYKEADTTEDRLEAKAKDHLRREKPDVADNPMKVMPTSGYDFKINIDELMKGKEVALSQAQVSKEELPYKVRTDYRKGAEFVHRDFGPGKILTTSNGASGQPDQRGILDWIEVEFKKPYIKGGKVIYIRRLPNIYATAYWLNKA